MVFLITVAIPYLKYFFHNVAIIASGKGRATIFLTLVPLLIQILNFVFFSLSFLFKSLTALVR